MIFGEAPPLEVTQVREGDLGAPLGLLDREFQLPTLRDLLRFFQQNGLIVQGEVLVEAHDDGHRAPLLDFFRN